MPFNTYTDDCLFRQQEEIRLEKKKRHKLYKEKDLFKEKYLDFINNTLYKTEIQPIKQNIRGKYINLMYKKELLKKIYLKSLVKNRNTHSH